MGPVLLVESSSMRDPFRTRLEQRRWPGMQWRRQLETNYNGIKAPERPKLFSVAAKEYIALSRARLA